MLMMVGRKCFSFERVETMASKAKTWSETFAELRACGAFPGVVHRILLYGPPGTGKSSALPGERVACHRQMCPDDLIGGWQLRDGNTIWIDGPAVRAMRDGSALILDEIDQHSADVRAALHAILDDRAAAQLHLPSGEVIRPKEGYCVIGTSNALPNALPDALLDRFEVLLHADKPAGGLLASIKNNGVRAWLKNHYDRQKNESFQLACTARRCLSLDRLAGAGLALDFACSLVGFPSEASSAISVAGQ